jgi:phosphopentomutase
MLKRAIVLVLDSVGIGALPDAWQYGDVGANTLAHVAERVGSLELPNLAELGLGHLASGQGLTPAVNPRGSFGRMAELSVGKDTTVGHWELMGIVTTREFPTYPQGFPAELIREFERRIGRAVLGNRPASGTEIIAQLGPEHLRTGRPIVYTSADSVFQVAAHEAVIPPEELYRICLVARELLTGRHAVARVIARPFEGEPGHFRRTERRKDFNLPPPEPTLLDRALEYGLDSIGVGKVGDIFAHRGFSREVQAPGNAAVLSAVLDELAQDWHGVLLANFVDFDMLYGHRNDPVGYAQALRAFDAGLPAIVASLREDDGLFITADHGCDPTLPSTDHTREHVPLLCCGARLRQGVNLGARTSFADLAATLSELCGLPKGQWGRSFAPELVHRG